MLRVHTDEYKCIDQANEKVGTRCRYYGAELPNQCNLKRVSKLETETAAHGFGLTGMPTQLLVLYHLFSNITRDDRGMFPLNSNNVLVGSDCWIYCCRLRFSIYSRALTKEPRF